MITLTLVAILGVLLVIVLMQLFKKTEVVATPTKAPAPDLARKRKLYMRNAAYVIAVNRVAQACKDRGWV